MDEPAPVVPPNRIVYHVVYRVLDGDSWYECPICGRLEGAVLRGHGLEHVVEDASI